MFVARLRTAGPEGRSHASRTRKTGVSLMPSGHGEDSGPSPSPRRWGERRALGGADVIKLWPTARGGTAAERGIHREQPFAPSRVAASRRERRGSVRDRVERRPLDGLAVADALLDAQPSVRQNALDIVVSPHRFRAPQRVDHQSRAPSRAPSSARPPGCPLHCDRWSRTRDTRRSSSGYGCPHSAQ